MARPFRIQYPGAFYHVTSRGNERKDIFRSDADRLKFLAYLESASEGYGAVIHAYCLLDNHYCLLIETPLGNLSRIMGHINGAYTTYFNAQRKRSGHLFQGRYKSVLIEADAYATELSGYIHLIPVRAGIVSRPEEFFWSSYRAYIGEVVPPGWLTTDFVLNLIPSGHGRGPAEYRAFVEDHLGLKVLNPLAATVGGTLLGSDSFIRQVTERHVSRDQRDTRRAVVPPPKRNLSIERIIATVDATFTEDVKFSGKTSIYLCHKLSGKTLREIGTYFGLGDSGVSQACRRFADALDLDPLLKQKLLTLKNQLIGSGAARGEVGGASRELQRLELRITEVLKGFPEVFFATLFGSAAKGRMTEQSDVDIAVAARTRLSIETRGRLAIELSGALGREVDLVDCQAVSGFILEQALCSGVIVKNADHDLYAGLLKRFWYNQADMMPYCRQILEKRNNRWLQA